MNDVAKSEFVYVTYIRTTSERLWEALTSSDFAMDYWLGVRPEAEWKKGGAWKLILPDGRLGDAGEITEYNPPERLCIRWRNEWSAELKDEGWSLCSMVLEPTGDAVKLTVSHTMERKDSLFISAVSGGWPKILSNLKSFLETGEVVVRRSV
jgi:uncharacterized protein YndB with AHSA1/START domain